MSMRCEIRGRGYLLYILTVQIFELPPEYKSRDRVKWLLSKWDLDSALDGGSGEGVFRTGVEEESRPGSVEEVLKAGVEEESGAGNVEVSD